ncbi:MAG: hypothetical protein MHPSP_003963, partial [Paramarteilia canceri]
MRSYCGKEPVQDGSELEEQFFEQWMAEAVDLYGCLHMYEEYYPIRELNTLGSKYLLTLYEYELDDFGLLNLPDFEKRLDKNIVDRKRDIEVEDGLKSPSKYAKIIADSSSNDHFILIDEYGTFSLYKVENGNLELFEDVTLQGHIINGCMIEKDFVKTAGLDSKGIAIWTYDGKESDKPVQYIKNPKRLADKNAFFNFNPFDNKLIVGLSSGKIGCFDIEKESSVDITLPKTTKYLYDYNKT